jgi:threonine synthase
MDYDRCRCGEPTWFDIDTSDFEWSDVNDRGGVWRYTDVLPVAPAPGLGSASGETPLFRAERLDDYAGCHLFVKDEGQNPTGSFKDRGSAIGVTWAAQAGREWVGTVSHGNMAMSMSAHAVDHDMGCIVLVPARIPPGRLGLIAQYDPELLRVEGDYGQLYYDTLAIETDPDIEFINSDVPLRVEGQKTIAYEICEQFAPDTPDALVLPLSSGGHASAVWKALRELDDADLLEEVPRLYFAQTEAVDPIAQAFRRGDETVTDVEPSETIAFSISNGSPPSGNRALTAARQTNGGIQSVSEEAIGAATRRLASHAGICVEPACATTLAAIRQLTDDEEIEAGETVVAIMTGTGFKELNRRDTKIATTDVSLDTLDSELAGVIR